MQKVPSYRNPDLVAGDDNVARWNRPDLRRHAFHNIHRLTRYGHRFRASDVMRLEKRMDLSIAARDDVARLTSLPWFSAMIIARGSHILYEKCAPDFSAHQPHSIMSISKMTMNLIVGRLVDEGKIDLRSRIDHYLPWLGAGYAGATVQEVLDMNVNNDYTEDYNHPSAIYLRHEAATGWRLPERGQPEGSARSFLAQIGFAPGMQDTTNRSGVAMYKSANTDVLGFAAEVASGRRIQSFMADIADAAGFEHNLDIASDRDGFTMPDGGISLTIRDLARFGAIFARQGHGIDGEPVGSAAFIRATSASGVPCSPPRERLRYSNMTFTNGRWIGHGGFGGQFMLVDLATGTIGAFLSVIEDAGGYDPDYYVPIIDMLESICSAC
jgi:CubicO group peptidase (beta-lactamase class C family)